MNREETIKVLNMVEAHGSLVIQAKEMAIKALEQEPCEDAISRQAAIDAVRVGAFSTATLYGRTEEGETARKEIERLIKDLPSVSTEKTGRWITDRCDMYICSKCNHTYTDLSGERYGMNFCPNCGANMVEPQESEDKE